MVYHGCIRNGVVVLEGDVRLAEGTAVTVETSEDPIYRLSELAVPTGVPDLATNVDHYLYGHPKADDAQS
jgi:hypothetical protein